jgi:hypothetical protein
MGDELFGVRNVLVVGFGVHVIGGREIEGSLRRPV